MSRTITVVGAGSWGTALSIHMARAGHGVKLWAYEDEVRREIEEKRENTVFLKGFKIPQSVVVTNILEEAINGAGIILFVVPSDHSRQVFQSMKGSQMAGARLVIATKGIECDSLKLMSEIASEVLGGEGLRDIGVLSGPSFALEVARGDPTAVVVSSRGQDCAEYLQKEISFGNFRAYTNTDMTGVQLAGSLKNVVAIAAGIIEGIGFGYNTIAALITRGTSEIRRLGVKMGGDPGTFAGLAGIGDLILTCTGKLSRNRSVGYRLGRGEDLETILSGMRMVAEGLKTSIAVKRLAVKFNVEMPIAAQVHAVLYEKKKPSEAIQDLLSRPLKEED